MTERNAADLDDVPREVREHMTFHIVGTVDEVLARALEPQRSPPLPEDSSQGVAAITT